jgi:hypothetical protein
MLSIIEILKTRPELAVIFAALSSMIIYQLKTLPGLVWSGYKRFFTVNLEVDSRCEAFFYENKEFIGHDFPISPAEIQKAFMLYSTSPAMANQYLLNNKDVL